MFGYSFPLAVDDLSSILRNCSVQKRSFVQIRSRLASQVGAGDFYEAQQTYKATFARYKSKGAYPNAYSILQVS
jgi:hypothetical protein